MATPEASAGGGGRVSVPSGYRRPQLVSQVLKSEHLYVSFHTQSPPLFTPQKYAAIPRIPSSRRPASSKGSNAKGAGGSFSLHRLPGGIERKEGDKGQEDIGRKTWKMTQNSIKHPDSMKNQVISEGLTQQLKRERGLRERTRAACYAQQQRRRQDSLNWDHRTTTKPRTPRRSYLLISLRLEQ